MRISEGPVVSPLLRDPAVRVDAADPVVHAGPEVDAVVLGDEDRIDRVQVGPLLQESPFLVEDLYAVVLAVGHVEAPARVHGQAVRSMELAGLDAQLAPRLDELPPGVELDDARVAVAVGDEDVARRGDHD